MTDIEFRMPKLAMAMVEGTVEEWLVEEGAAVVEGQEIVSISTDKVENELPSPGSGIVRQIVTPAGRTVPVGAVLAIISS